MAKIEKRFLSFGLVLALMFINILDFKRSMDISNS